jgi:uncharacterized protein
MRCPVDGETLVMSERHGVEIDYCPGCRGVWLDRGELDRIIGNAGVQSSSPSSPSARYHDDDDERGYREPPRKKKSRFSALTDLLGGDD